VQPPFTGMPRLGDPYLRWQVQPPELDE
jgi:hypothetical protein